MTFCKYQFSNPTEWETYKAQITDTEGNPVNCAIVEIGQLADGYAVDILWGEEPLDSFTTKEVFPDPVGVHTFLGEDKLYLERFCDFNPLSPYCTNDH